jgi:hypothetical protein
MGLEIDGRELSESVLSREFDSASVGIRAPNDSPLRGRFKHISFQPDSMAVEPLEFFDPGDEENNIEWSPVEGYPDGIHEKVLYRDEEDGSHSRLIRVEAGIETEEPFEHDFFEEVFVLEGWMIDHRLDKEYGTGYYAMHPPGMIHGPFSFPVGLLAFEARYYR